MLYLSWKHHRRESGLLARLDQAAIASGSTHSDKSGKRRCFTSVPAASPRPRDSSNGTSAFKYHNIRGHNHQQPTSPYISTLSRSLDNMSMQSPRALESGSTMPAGDALSRSAPLGRCEHNQKEFFSPNQAANACDGLSPELQLGKLTELSVVFPRATSSSRTDSMSEHALSGDSTDSNDGAPFPGFDVGLNEASIDWLPPELWTDFDDEDKSLDDGLAEERYMGDVLRLLLSESPTLRMMESSPPQKQGSSATSCMLDIVDVVDVVGLRVECDPNSSPIVSKKSAHPF